MGVVCEDARTRSSYGELEVKKRTFVIAAIVVAVSACGGGSDGASPTSVADTTLQPESVASDVPEVSEVEAVVETEPAAAETTVAPATTEAATTTTTTTTTTTEPEPDNVDLVAFGDALFGADLDEIASSIELTAPGSAARLYTEWQTDFGRSVLGSGLPLDDAATTAKRGDGFISCKDECTTYADVTFEDGLVSSFSVEGLAIEGRLGGASEPVSDGPISSAKVLSSYRTVIPEAIGVNVEIVALESVDLNLFGADYVAPNGLQVSQVEYYGPDQLRGSATGYVTIFFTDVDLGGTLYIGGNNDDFSNVFELAIPVPEL